MTQQMVQTLLAKPVSPLFYPRTIPGLRAWLDWQLSGITIATGVSVATDPSGRDVGYYQATGSKQPTLTNAGGFTFDNTDLLQTDAGSKLNFQYTDPFTMYLVARDTAGLGYTIGKTDDGGFGNRGWFWNKRGVAQNHHMRFCIVSSNSPVLEVLIESNGIAFSSTTLFYIFAISYNGNGLASGFTMVNNGVQEAHTVVFDNLAGNSIQQNAAAGIMAYQGANDGVGGVKINLVYDGAHSVAQMQRMSRYLSQRTGVVI